MELKININKIITSMEEQSNSINEALNRIMDFISDQFEILKNENIPAEVLPGIVSVLTMNLISLIHNEETGLVGEVGITFDIIRRLAEKQEENIETYFNKKMSN
jgi:hypothetical protein